MTASTTLPADAGLGNATWRLDPARSGVEFRVRNLYGLMTVKGRFHRYEGTLGLASHPLAELVVDATSLDTDHEKRDEHLRSADFFDVENHPQIRFQADSATYAGERLTLRGRLDAAGKRIPVEVHATIRPVGGEFEIDGTALADQRALGMTWSPFGVVRAPSTLSVHGRLVRAETMR